MLLFLEIFQRKYFPRYHGQFSWLHSHFFFAVVRLVNNSLHWNIFLFFRVYIPKTALSGPEITTSIFCVKQCLINVLQCLTIPSVTKVNQTKHHSSCKGNVTLVYRVWSQNPWWWKRKTCLTMGQIYLQ